MNDSVYLFRCLVSAWHLDAAAERVDQLAYELRTRVEQAHGPLCLGLIEPGSVQKYYGLVYFLDSLGLLLRKRHRQGGDATFVYIESKRDSVASDRTAPVMSDRGRPHALPRAA